MKQAAAEKLTTRQVAEKLKAAHSSVRMWLSQGKFPNAESIETPRGPVWLIPESDLKGFEKRDRGRPPKATPSPNGQATKPARKRKAK